MLGVKGNHAMRSRQSTAPAHTATAAESGLDDLMVAEVLHRWPGTLSVFLRYRLACVGCVMARFERLAEVPRIYGLDEQRFLREVRQAVYPQEQPL
jgi:hybrid cluster-associated redox disulfide protein